MDSIAFAYLRRLLRKECKNTFTLNIPHFCHLQDLFCLWRFRSQLQANSKMAEVASGGVVQSGIQPQDSSSYMNGNCVNRVLMNKKYQAASVGLKYLRLINNMLHEEIKILRSQQEDIRALREETFSPCKTEKVTGGQCSSVVSAQVTL